MTEAARSTPYRIRVQPPGRSRAEFRAAGLVVLAAILFGTTGTAQALGPDSVSPSVIGAGRIVVGGLLLALVGTATGQLRDGIRWRRGVVLLAAVGVAGYQVGFFAAVDRAGVAVGTIVTIGSAPAFTGLLGWLAGQGRPSRVWAVATALAVAGGALLAGSGGGEASADPVGLALGLLAGASYALYTVAAKRLLDDGHRPAGVMAAAFGLGGLVLAPVLVALGPAAVRAEPSVLLVVLYLAVVPTAVAYLLFARGLKRLPAPTVATLTLAEPVVAGTLGIVVLAEPVTATRALGAVLVLAGLMVLAWRPLR